MNKYIYLWVVGMCLCSLYSSAQVSRLIRDPVWAGPPKLDLLKIRTAPNIPDKEKLAVKNLPPIAIHQDKILEQSNSECLFSLAAKSLIELEGDRATDALVKLDWVTKNGRENYRFEIERSFGDTLNFVVVDHEWAKSNASGSDRYRAPDNNDYSKVSYYRVKLILRNGEQVYSNIAAVKGYSSFTMNVFPNPAAETLSFLLSDVIKGKAVINIYDASGRIVFQHLVSMFDGVNQQVLSVKSLGSGSYTIKIDLPGGRIETGKFIKR